MFIYTLYTVNGEAVGESALMRQALTTPAASRTHAAHTHTAQIRHPAAHAGSCAAPAAPHDQAPRQHESPPDYQAGQAFSFA